MRTSLDLYGLYLNSRASIVDRFGGARKQILNEGHKMVPYKLDGPANKVRIQTPQEKAFVLLQAAMGQNYLDDFTLRQEISYISTAWRMNRTWIVLQKAV